MENPTTSNSTLNFENALSKTTAWKQSLNLYLIFELFALLLDSFSFPSKIPMCQQQNKLSHWKDWIVTCLIVGLKNLAEPAHFLQQFATPHRKWAVGFKSGIALDFYPLLFSASKSNSHSEQWEWEWQLTHWHFPLGNLLSLPPWLKLVLNSINISTLCLPMRSFEWQSCFCMHWTDQLRFIW